MNYEKWWDDLGKELRKSPIYWYEHIKNSIHIFLYNLKLNKAIKKVFKYLNSLNKEEFENELKKTCKKCKGEK